MQNNITYTLRNRLCLGCGICEDICPKKCITIGQKDGENNPVFDQTRCLGDNCGRCLKVCPGIGINLKETSRSLYGNGQKDKYIGHYVSLHTGYSLDNSIRFHGASGGLVSQFLIYLLEKKIIDGAVVTAFSETEPLSPISYIARTKEDIVRARSSKYCPVSLNKVGNEIKNSEGKYVIVGLPCHIQGFRKRALIDRKFKEKVLGYFSIYCSSNRTFKAQEFLLKKYDVKKENVTKFAYRDNGCLGDMVIEAERQGQEFPSSETDKCSGCRESKSKISIPYIRYYGALRSFFKPRRCLTCIDHYGELADVCFGDIHIKPYSNDKVGVSSWIVRNPFFDDLFKKAAMDGYIRMDELDAYTLNESQKAMLYPKKRKAKALMKMDKCRGRVVAEYDVEMPNPQWKDYVSVWVTNIQRFIGRHRFLWFIIDCFYDKRNNNGK